MREIRGMAQVDGVADSGWRGKTELSLRPGDPVAPCFAYSLIRPVLGKLMRTGNFTNPLHDYTINNRRNGGWFYPNSFIVLNSATRRL